MMIVHPQAPVNGLNPEDVFYAIDDLGAQAGYGFILYQQQPGLYPDCPVNMYFSIAGDPSARYLLFGALVARARVTSWKRGNVGLCKTGNSYLF